MIRVVLDTNILVSALLQPHGFPARTFLIALAGTTAQLCVSGDIYAEYDEVLRAPLVDFFVRHFLTTARGGCRESSGQ